MNHEMPSEEDDSRAGSDRSFGFVMSLVLLIIAAVPLLSGGSWRVWALGAAAGLAATSALAPALLGPLNRLWSALGELLRRITTPLILGFIFFLVITPLGLLMRLLGKDLLRLRIDPAASSYWITRNPPGPKPESFKDQF